ncbi:hypothetical protein PoB_006098300 [Plakobranchus ocellatus]|uniref:Uncharacterized protein n=1 Tax=Plakobranchus ocellatus TaxID=259542 RepID=A0AAV4CRF6_9GAST|nr:hypothetical protein PoB_006098300 [Plakobranchus ocellatus]
MPCLVSRPFEECELQVTAIKYEALKDDVLCDGAAVAADVDLPSIDKPRKGSPVSNETTELLSLADTSSASARNKKKIKFSEISTKSRVTFFVLAIAYFALGCGFSVPAPFFPKEVIVRDVYLV